MSQLPYQEFEIVGFAGGVQAACGRALVLAHHKQTNRFFRLSEKNSVPEQGMAHTADEIRSFSEAGLLTLFAMPVPAFPQAMVLYVTRELLEASASQLPLEFNKETFHWQILQNDTWATCASYTTVEQLMICWTERLMNRANDLLVDFFSTQDQNALIEAERLSLLALSPACNQALRASLYLRYGLAVLYSAAPERLQRMYSLIMRPWFSSWTKETFEAQLVELANSLQMRSLMERTSLTRAIEPGVVIATVETSFSPPPSEQREAGIEVRDAVPSTRTDVVSVIDEHTLENNLDVFLSYSSVDQVEAMRLFKAINSAGGRAFLASKSLTPGDDFAEEIRKALHSCRQLWLLVSPNSVKSEWVISEWGAAWALGKKIVPILHQCKPEDLPDRIRRLHAIEYDKYRDLIKSTFPKT